MEEMIASGRLASVASPELKKAIAEFRETMRYIGVVNDTLGRQIGEQVMSLRLMVKMNPERTTIVTPPDQLNHDDEFYIN